REIEAKGRFHLPMGVTAYVTFAIGAITAKDEPCLHQSRQMAAKRSISHATRTQRQFRIGRENNNRLRSVQLTRRMKTQQSLQHRYSAVGKAEGCPCFRQRAQQLPLFGSAGVIAGLIEALTPLINLLTPQKTGRTHPAAA